MSGVESRTPILWYNTMPMKIATDIYTFSELRGLGFHYVDKTAGILSLVNASIGKQFFCARPRRFGKSLLVTTLQALFEGRRELFGGLVIDKSDYDWKKYPVMRLDMGSCQSETVEGFWEKVGARLESEARRNGVACPSGVSASVAFSTLIETLAAKSPEGRMVLLVDEYDKPLLGHLGTPEVTKFKTALKEFYSVIKTQESCQRFTFMTGVSKFSKVSIFSDLNNLTDITMDARYATLLGYTREELKVNFPEMIAALAEANGLTPEGAFAKLEEMYDGFKFEENAERVFNPVSVGKCLSQKKFDYYWFETGTPTFLVDLLKRDPLEGGEATVTTADLASAYEPEQVSMLPLMVQTGYLTIKSAMTRGGSVVCTLGYPNAEVAEAMSKHLALGFSNLRPSEFSSISNQIFDALYAGDPEEMLQGVKCFFENIPYDLQVKYEKYYQSLFYSVFLMLNAQATAEVKTARGRIDAVVETPDYIYVFEFKLRGTSEEALAQIEEKGYAAKFASDPRKLFRIGCAFDWDQRNLGRWIIA